VDLILTIGIDALVYASWVFIVSLGLTLILGSRHGCGTCLECPPRFFREGEELSQGGPVAGKTRGKPIPPLLQVSRLSVESFQR
jgi:hypothetical protein